MPDKYFALQYKLWQSYLSELNNFPCTLSANFLERCRHYRERTAEHCRHSCLFRSWMRCKINDQYDRSFANATTSHTLDGLSQVGVPTVLILWVLAKERRIFRIPVYKHLMNRNRLVQIPGLDLLTMVLLIVCIFQFGRCISITNSS